VNREGFAQSRVSLRLDLAGLDFMGYLAKISSECGYSFTTTVEREIVRDAKEELSYIALDSDAGMKAVMDSSDKEKIAEPPDGSDVIGGRGCFCCRPAVFQPGLVDEASGIYDIALQPVMKRDADIREEEWRYTALDSDSGMEVGMESLDGEETSELPDVSGRGECFCCPGELFQPSSADVEASGIHGTIFQPMMKCDADIRKEKLRCTAPGFDNGMQEVVENWDGKKTSELPHVRRGECFCCPEVLFQPSLADVEASGIHDTTFQLMVMCEVDIRKERRQVTGGWHVMLLRARAARSAPVPVCVVRARG